MYRSCEHFVSHGMIPSRAQQKRQAPIVSHSFKATSFGTGFPSRFLAFASFASALSADSSRLVVHMRANVCLLPMLVPPPVRLSLACWPCPRVSTARPPEQEWDDTRENAPRDSPSPCSCAPDSLPVVNRTRMVGAKALHALSVAAKMRR